MSKRPPQERSCTRMDRYSWAVLVIGGVAITAILADPSWPDWQAVILGLFLGSNIGTYTRDAWWRKELRSTGL